MILKFRIFSSEGFHLIRCFIQLLTKLDLIGHLPSFSPILGQTTDFRLGFFSSFNCSRKLSKIAFLLQLLVNQLRLGSCLSSFNCSRKLSEIAFFFSSTPPPPPPRPAKPQIQIGCVVLCFSNCPLKPSN